MHAHFLRVVVFRIMKKKTKGFDGMFIVIYLVSDFKKGGSAIDLFRLIWVKTFLLKNHEVAR